MNLMTGIAAVLLAVLATVRPALAGQDEVDPLASPRWADMRYLFPEGATLRFDPRVRVLAPAVAENPLQVPLTVDASELGPVSEVLVFADFNPIVEVMRFFPEAAPAWLGFRIKLQQSTPVRAAARTADGVWHVGGTWVTTVGGGCTVPSAKAGSPDWQARLNQVSGRQWNRGAQADRIRLRIEHPMDTGLVAGIPAFHLDQVELLDAAGQRLMRLQLHEPVSENPVFTLRRGAVAGPVEVRGYDNNGNAFHARIAP
ncbi:quinoprotein dehydrogenase-associated SoxYZ-like carrier [Azonexus hydrophilus]|uniref:Quinoprotein dehydrogenase-associated SoxYZ-like carrier n=1 Tax=Azonexus hydrophilus TaxID=418702 RepID=A0A1R1I5L2_9RHOO|nr:quinoprotein dehydrogenase-associated SoxYZ-like carrier [Azonexus hydrophilus]OMG53934.1 quinoprotein dehydrogenase-associated SoxYZ-like carrier [Azonexus hydrophilus]